MRSVATKEMKICRLCARERELKLSHIIPSFVYKWLKDTSATGFLRGGTDPNVRRQDGHKDYLLCEECEQVLSKHEQKFASRFFYPYVNDVLDANSDIRIDAPKLTYEDWLLRFAISVQWRSLLMQEEHMPKLEGRRLKELEKLRSAWADFLLGKSDHSGEYETYLIPYSNLSSAEGDFPSNMNDRTNFYLLRSADLTIVSSKKKLMIFTKIGPIGFLTSVYPSSSKGMQDLRIKWKSEFNFKFGLNNAELGTYLLVTRPNEVMGRHQLSPASQAMIDKSYAKNPERVMNSKTVLAQLADHKLKKKSDC